MAGGANETFHFLIVGVPLSPLHGGISIGQELCLRGHKVTVLSFADRGRQKVEKYSKACKLNYVSLGPLPVDEELEEALLKEGMSSNSTLHHFEHIVKQVLMPSNDALALGVEKYLENAERPTFGLVSMPFGLVGRLLEQRGVDFAVNIPTILVPPVPWAAAYVPVPFVLDVSVHDMSFLERMLVIGSNWLFNLVRVAALTAGYRLSFMPELGWDMWMGRLVFVNTIPGMDYTQPLPPLVQYTGPVVDVKKMEPFPEDVERWLEEGMCQNRIWTLPPKKRKETRHIYIYIHIICVCVCVVFSGPTRKSCPVSKARTPPLSGGSGEHARGVRQLRHRGVSLARPRQGDAVDVDLLRVLHPLGAAKVPAGGQSTFVFSHGEVGGKGGGEPHLDRRAVMLTSQ